MITLEKEGISTKTLPGSEYMHEFVLRFPTSDLLYFVSVSSKGFVSQPQADDSTLNPSLQGRG